MCIRDRHGHTHRPAIHRFEIAQHEAATRIVLGDWYEQGSVCLLYTSDAADERSSVDLGGSRIIKKKNKDERERTGEEYETEAKQNHQKKDI